MLQLPDGLTAATWTLSVTALYGIAVATYRLVFSPLAKFPGPKMAAVTLWYDFYWDVVRPGQYVFRIREMHKKYGPIVRVSPYELHIEDSDYFEEIYGGKPDKWDYWANTTTTSGAVVATVPHALHKLRRAPMNPFFSHRNIASLEPLIQARVEKLSSRLEAAADSGEAVRLETAFVALTIDVISTLCFDMDRSHLDEKDFGRQWRDASVTLVEKVAAVRHFPWLLPVFEALPKRLIKMLNPGVACILHWKETTNKQVEAVLSREKLNGGADRDKRRTTVFHDLLYSNLPSEEKSLVRMCEEAQLFTLAGSETTAHTLYRIVFFLKMYPLTLAKLREELCGVMPDKTIPSWNTLENLPYTSAVVKEGLRISGMMLRSPRISHEPKIYKEWVIPAGTPVATSLFGVLMDPQIFPEPGVFRPERWIEAEAAGQRLDRYMVAFSKGTRACIGINLAYAELYITLAMMVLRFDWDFVENLTLEDAVPVLDAGVAHSRLDQIGLTTMLRKIT